MALTTTFTANASNNTTSLGYNFTSQSFGSESADRYVLVGVAGQGASAAAVSSVTIGGVSATQLFSVSSTTNTVAFWIAAVPTGTSGAVFVQWVSQRSRCAITVWRVVGGVSTTAYDTGSEVNSGSTPLNDNVNIVEGGSCVGMVYDGGTGSRTWTWSGLTEAVDTTFASGRSYSAAAGNFASAETNRAISATPSGSTTANVLAIVSLAPLVGGTGAVLLGGLAISGQGGTRFAGAGAIALPGVSVAASAESNEDVSVAGSAAVVLREIEAAALAQERIVAAAAMTLDRAAIAGLAAETMTGNAALVLAGPAIAAESTLRNPAAAAIGLTALSIAASGGAIEFFTGAGALDLAGVRIAAAAGERFDAAGALAFDPVALAASASGFFEGMGALALGGAALSASAFERISGAAAIAVDGAAISAAARETIAAGAALAFAGPAIAALANEVLGGAAAFQLAGMEIGAAALLTIAGAGDVALEALSIGGSALSRIAGSGELFLIGASIEGSALSRVFGNGVVALTPIEIGALAAQTAFVIGAGDVALVPVVIGATGFGAQIDPRVVRRMVLANDRGRIRAIAGPGHDRALVNIVGRRRVLRGFSR
jgi:hypothetical protein